MKMWDLKKCGVGWGEGSSLAACILYNRSLRLRLQTQEDVYELQK